MTPNELLHAAMMVNIRNHHPLPMRNHDHLLMPEVREGELYMAGIRVRYDRAKEILQKMIDALASGEVSMAGEVPSVLCDSHTPDWVSPEARAYMREMIVEHGCCECLFMGEIEGGRIERVRTEAIGDPWSVPAVTDRARRGEVAIHNHPSGHLDPSRNDMAYAVELARRGAGCLIVDNLIVRCRLVVPPDQPAEVELIGAQCAAA